MKDETSPHVQATSSPSAVEARAALERILASSRFRRSRRTASFLRFVIEEQLAGRGDRLKAFTIAREVYGRDEHFDPRTDTIVRVEAGRLRQRLAAYYEDAGAADPVRIEIPKGGYTPTISRHVDTTPAGQDEASSPDDASARITRRKTYASVSVLVIGMLLVGWLYLMDRGVPLETADTDNTGKDPDSSPPAAFLVILPFEPLSEDALDQQLAAGLLEAILTDLAKLSGLSVMAHASLLNLDARSPDLDALRRDYGATHALRGSLEHEDGRIRVNVQLVDTRSGAMVWADRLDGEAEHLLDVQDVLAERIAEHLAVHISPQEQALLQRHHTDNLEALVLYHQALVLLMPPNDMDGVITARNMFQRVIEIDPAFAGGYAGKGFSHAVTVLFMKALEPAVELQTGIHLSLKAIETDPEFGMGYASLAFAYALSGRKEEALSNARRAIAVQPGDAFTQFVYGLSLTLSGQPQEAIAPLSEATRLDPAESRTPYRNVMGIAQYLNGDYARAIELFDENLDRGGPAGPHMDALRASALAELGKEDQARAMIRGLLQTYPAFPAENWLAIWLKNSSDQAAIMDKLYRLGLPRSRQQ